MTTAGEAAVTATRSCEPSGVRKSDGFTDVFPIGKSVTGNPSIGPLLDALPDGFPRWEIGQFAPCLLVSYL